MPRRIDFATVLARLKAFHAKRRRLPSFSELQTLLHYRSKGSAAALVRRLVEKRIVQKDAQGKLIPTAYFGNGVKLIGSVQAGFPSPAEEELVDTMSLDEFLIPNPQACYLLKVSGDSMADAGILPGDLVIAQKGRLPKNGDIVIAQVDGDWTMKYYEKQKDGSVLLRPANKKYQTIRAANEVVISAVVVANVRKYHR